MIALSERPRVAWREGALGPRDRVILALAVDRLAGQRVDLARAARALREVVAEVIPSGRVFWLGERGGAPVVGSQVSGVGVCEDGGRVIVVRRGRSGGWERLGPMAP